MAYPVHDNWYQRRSICGGRRHAGDRDIQNLYSEGVLESRNNTIRGPHSAGLQQCQKSAIHKSLHRMEEVLAHMLNILDKQSQNMSELSKQYQADLEQFKNKNLEQQTDLKVAHHKHDTIDPKDLDEVIEQDEEEKKNTVKEIQKTELTEKHSEGDPEECAEVVAKEVEHEDSTEIEVAECGIVVDTVDNLVNLEGGENKSSVQGVHDISVAKSPFHREYRQLNSSGNIAQQFRFTCFLFGKSFDNEYLGFWNKRKTRRPGVRHRKNRTRKLPVGFTVVKTACGRYGSPEWPAKVRRRWRMKLQHRRKEKRTTIYGEELMFRSFHPHQNQNQISIFTPKKPMGVEGGLGGVRGGDGGVGGCGGCGVGGSGGATDERTTRGTSRSRCSLTDVDGGRGTGEKSSGVGDGSYGGGRCSSNSIRVELVEQLRAIMGEYFQICNRTPNTCESCWKNLESRVRGMRVISIIHDMGADVIYSHFNPIPIFGPMFRYTQLGIWPTHTSTISLGLPIFFEVLARITFYPP